MIFLYIPKRKSWRSSYLTHNMWITQKFNENQQSYGPWNIAQNSDFLMIFHKIANISWKYWYFEVYQRREVKDHRICYTICELQKHSRKIHIVMALGILQKILIFLKKCKYFIEILIFLNKPKRKSWRSSHLTHITQNFNLKKQSYCPWKCKIYRFFGKNFKFLIKYLVFLYIPKKKSWRSS